MLSKINLDIAYIDSELGSILNTALYNVIEGQSLEISNLEVTDSLLNSDLLSRSELAALVTSGLISTHVFYRSSVLDNYTNAPNLLEVINLISMSLVQSLSNHVTLAGNAAFTVPTNMINTITSFNNLLAQLKISEFTDIISIASEFVSNLSIEDKDALIPLYFSFAPNYYFEGRDCSEVEMVIHRDNYASGGGRSAQTGFDSNINGFVASKLLNVLTKISNNNFSALLKGVNFLVASVEVDYEANIIQVLGDKFKSDYSLRKPKSTFHITGLLEPTLVDERVHLVFGVDYSGSNSLASINEQLGCIDKVLSQYTSYSFSVIVFSGEVRKVVRNIESPTTLRELVGTLGENIGDQGGTIFQCVYDEVATWDNLHQLSSIAILSEDGCGGNLCDKDLRSKNYNGDLLFLFDDNQYSRNQAREYSTLEKSVVAFFKTA